MYTQLRLSHVALNPELALGVLPSRQLCLLSSAQAEDDPTITRLIFPVAAADVCDLTRDLYSHGFGHKVVLSGFAVKPQLTYIKLRDPELSEWDDVAALRRALHLDAQGSLVASALLHSVIRTDAPCLLVSSMAWEHSSGHYQAEAPRFSFDHLVGQVITYQRTTEPRYRVLYEGYHQIPRSWLEGRYRCQAARHMARLNCARALSALDWSGERLAAPTELTANRRLESFLNPESLTPAYGAFLARNGLCEGPGVSPLASYRAHQVFLNGIKQRPSA